MIRIFNINEISLIRFFFHAALGQGPYVLAIDPMLPPLRGLLQRAVDWMVGAGRARWVIDLAPELQSTWDYPSRILMYDVFGETEEWMNDYFGFAAADRAVDDYARAFKHLTCCHVRHVHFPYLLIEAALASQPAGQATVIGLPPDTVAGLEAYWGRSFAPAIRRAWLPRRMFNTALSISVTLYSLAWVLSRLRLRSFEPEDVFFAADYMDDPRDFRIYHEVADGGPILLVPREPSRRPEQHDELADYAIIDQTDGWFTPVGVMAAMGLVLRDGIRLAWHFRKCPSPLFYQVVALPWRRTVLRAFFSRFRPKYYWGRDDYNVEHILRRDEIHRVGGQSIGINHGYSFYSNFYPMWRYISFDRYYVFGRAQYDRFTKDTWGDHMAVVPVGTFGASREDYARRVEPKPHDIVVFTSVFACEPGMVDVVRGLAEAFPDRKILLQVKSTFMATGIGRNFVAACTDGLANVVHTKAPLFELFRQGRYGFSDPSTVVVEAMQFGMASFCVDLPDTRRKTLHREYPGLCVENARQAVERIRAIEDGREPYEAEKYAELIDLSGQVIFDVIREDLGLPPKVAPELSAGTG